MEATPPRSATARRYPAAALVTPHYLATAAGTDVLARGGNAVDAIVAANLVLGVVTPYFCGVGGDIFAVVWDGSLHGYLGAGRAPAGATPEAVRNATQGDHVPPAYRALAGGTRAPGLGPHSVTVPQAVEGWFTLLGRWGTRSFGDVATAAIGLARDGFELTTTGCEMFAGAATIYSAFPAWNRRYGGLTPGARLRQPGLADLLELLAADGPDAYYRGPVAESIVETVRAEGGFLDEEDLAAHAGEFCAPLRANYRDSEIVELPPPTQGVTALEILRILDGFELAGMDPAARQHLIAEATKLGLLDRDEHVTDPIHMRSAARELLADDHIVSRRAEIDPESVIDRPAGVPQRGGTAYLCAADSDGLLVSLIQSNFFAFGSGLHVHRWGINLQNRGASFSLDDRSVNVIAPGKRPMHTLIPAMVMRDDEPWLVFGSMGGDAQAQVHAQVLARRIDDRADIQAAIHAPRWRLEPDDWATMRIEDRVPADVAERLTALGHRVRTVAPFDSGMGHAHAIELTPGGYAAAVDPRCEGAIGGR
ncbi:MAG TPA: gamma-glutamyltransferase family protein [Acidimicrobiia bacterium]|nr:gamma-glutamyltransferase family protein [Acidimicrobiia bacterium]